jgi:hypothetical protein
MRLRSSAAVLDQQWSGSDQRQLCLRSRDDGCRGVDQWTHLARQLGGNSSSVVLRDARAVQRRPVERLQDFQG